MNVPNETLDRWHSFAGLVRRTTMSVRLCYAQGKRDQAKEQLQKLHDAAIITEQSMERMGAQTAPSPAMQGQAGVPIHLLDTPANRLYLEKLREAWEAGLAVDRERYGESIGTDGEAQMLEMILADKELEVHGPVGTGE